jgi:hypothetical protein
MVPQSQSAAVAATLADVREQLAPMPRTRHAVTARCSDCGGEFVKRRDDDRTYCATCGAGRQLTMAEAHRYKEGPLYERIVRGQLKHWTAEAARIGLTDTQGGDAP